MGKQIKSKTSQHTMRISFSAALLASIALGTRLLQTDEQIAADVANWTLEISADDWNKGGDTPADEGEDDTGAGDGGNAGGSGGADAGAGAGAGGTFDAGDNAGAGGNADAGDNAGSSGSGGAGLVDERELTGCGNDCDLPTGDGTCVETQTTLDGDGKSCAWYGESPQNAYACDWPLDTDDFDHTLCCACL